MNTQNENCRASRMVIGLKCRWLWSVCLLLCISVAAFGATPTVNVLIDLKDARLQSAPNYTNRTVWVQAMSIPNISSPSVVLGQPIVGVTDTNGQFWVSNLVINLYNVEVKAPPRLESFKFLVITNYPGNINAADYLVADSTATFPAGTVAWAAAVTDQRYGGTVPRPSPAPGWFLTLSNNTAVWSSDGGSISNVTIDSSGFVKTPNGPGTNNDFRWILSGPTVWDRLYKVSSHGVSFEYQSGAINVFLHTFDSDLHVDHPPIFDYATTFSLPWFDGNGKLQSLNNGTLPGALTNDSNGNLGWFSDFLPDTGGFMTNMNLYFTDELGNFGMFNGFETWETNFSSTVPVTRVLGGVVPSFTVNGQILAEKSTGSSVAPLIVDAGGAFASDMVLVRSNGTTMARIDSNGTIRGRIDASSITNDAATFGAPTVAAYNPSQKLISIPNGSGALTNDNAGNVGWYTGFANGTTAIATLNGTGTNTALLNPTTTNGINYGNAFSSPASSSQSEQFGASASASAVQSTALGNQATASQTAATAVGSSSLASGAGSTAIGQLATATGLHSIALGFGVTTTTAHQIELGTSSEWVDAPGALRAGTITNLGGTASTVASYDANKKMVGIANATGWLHDDGSGGFTWSTPAATSIGFNGIATGTNTTGTMIVGTGANLYPTNGGNISANFATNVPFSGVVGSLNVSGTSSKTTLTQAVGQPSLTWDSTLNLISGTLFGVGDFSVNGNWTNRGFNAWGVMTNDSNGKFYSAPYLHPLLMGTNVNLGSANSLIDVSSNYSGGVLSYTLTDMILGLNNTFTGANQFQGTSTFTAAVQISANLTVSGNETVTGGFTNNSLTANTFIFPDANKRLISLANAAGALTNNGSGTFGYYNSFAPLAYVDAATNQLAIANTNRLLSLGANATNNDLFIGQQATNYANLQLLASKAYTDLAINTATNPFDTISDVNSKITGVATQHVYVATTDLRVLMTTNTASGPTKYTVNLQPGITNTDNGFEVTNSSAATSFSLLSKSNLVIKGTAPNLALGTDTNAMLALSLADLTFRAYGTNALSITNTLNGINIHGYWPFDLSFGNSFSGLITTGNVTNENGFRVTYIDEVRNLAASTNVSESIGPTQAANYVALTTDEIILINGNLTVTLPSAIGIRGHSFLVKTVSSGTNAILTSLGQTIDTYAKYTNTAVLKFTRVTSDNANYWVTGQN